jgi:uncharacterized membrane protein YagU involved in acid resistance
MSTVMLAFRKQMGEQPPDAIATAAADVAGLDTTEDQNDAIASVMHAAFGAVSGAVYALLPRYGPAPLRGVVLALGIWSSAYQGWVPALGILPTAAKDRLERPAVMIAAHVVFGWTLAVVEQRLRERD